MLHYIVDFHLPSFNPQVYLTIMKAVALILALAVITGKRKITIYYSFFCFLLVLMFVYLSKLSTCAHNRLQCPCCAPGRRHPTQLGGLGGSLLAVHL